MQRLILKHMMHSQLSASYSCAGHVWPVARRKEWLDHHAAPERRENPNQNNEILGNLEITRMLSKKEKTTTGCRYTFVFGGVSGSLWDSLHGLDQLGWPDSPNRPNKWEMLDLRNTFCVVILAKTLLNTTSSSSSTSTGSFFSFLVGKLCLVQLTRLVQ